MNANEVKKEEKKSENVAEVAQNASEPMIDSQNYNYSDPNDVYDSDDELQKAILLSNALAKEEKKEKNIEKQEKDNKKDEKAQISETFNDINFVNELMKDLPEGYQLTKEEIEKEVGKKKEEKKE